MNTKSCELGCVDGWRDVWRCGGFDGMVDDDVWMSWVGEEEEENVSAKKSH